MINSFDHLFLVDSTPSYGWALNSLSLFADPKANLLFWGIFSLLILWRKRENSLNSNVLYFFALTGLIMFICGILKIAAGRARPFLMDENIVGFYFFSVKNAYLSFPSSHSALAIAFTLTIKRLYKVTNLIFLFPLLICLSRILLKAHFATDVIAGILIGVFAEKVLRRLYKPSTGIIVKLLK